MENLNVVDVLAAFPELSHATAGYPYHPVVSSLWCLWTPERLFRRVGDPKQNLAPCPARSAFAISRSKDAMRVETPLKIR